MENQIVNDTTAMHNNRLQGTSHRAIARQAALEAKRYVASKTHSL
jgi:hypothetical protein